MQAKSGAEEAQRDLAALRSSSNADLEGHQESWQTRRAELEAEVGSILTWQLAFAPALTMRLRMPSIWLAPGASQASQLACSRLSVSSLYKL